MASMSASSPMARRVPARHTRWRWVPAAGGRGLASEDQPLLPLCLQVSGGPRAELLVVCVRPQGLERGHLAQEDPRRSWWVWGGTGALSAIWHQGALHLTLDSRPDHLCVSGVGLSFRRHALRGQPCSAGPGTVRMNEGSLCSLGWGGTSAPHGQPPQAEWQEREALRGGKISTLGKSRRWFLGMSLVC